VPHAGQELLILPEHLSAPQIFSGIRVARSLVFCVMFYISLIDEKCFFLTVAVIRNHYSQWPHCIDGVMVRVLASSVVDSGFESLSGQNKDNKKSL
jgi:hypothetical protein